MRQNRIRLPSLLALAQLSLVSCQHPVVVQGQTPTTAIEFVDKTTNEAVNKVLILPEYTSYAPWHNPFFYRPAEHPADRFIARPFVYERGSLFDLRQARWDGAAFWPMWATSRNAHLDYALVVETDHRIRWVAAHIIGQRPHDARVELERLDRVAAAHQLERLRRFVDARRIGGEELDQSESESLNLAPFPGFSLRIELTSAEAETIHQFLGETK